MGIFRDISDAVFNTRALQPGGIHNPQNSIFDVLNSIPGNEDSFTDDEIFSLSAPYRAIAILSNMVAVMGKSVYNKIDGSLEKDDGHYINRLIGNEPSPLYSHDTFWRTMATHLESQGNALARLFLDQAGRVREMQLIYPIDVYAIHLTTTGNGVRLRYEIYERVNGLPTTNRIILDYDEVLHFIGQSTSGYWGMSPVEVHRTNMLFSKNVRDYGQNFYKNRAHVSTVLFVNGKLTEKAYEQMLQTWNQTYHGPENAGKMAILQNGQDLKTIQFSPEDAQYLQTVGELNKVASQIWGVPSIMLEQMERATWDNAEQVYIQFVNNTLNPLVHRYEAEMNRKLFARRERGKKCVQFDMMALSRGDLKTRIEVTQRLFNMGMLNRDEGRSMWNQSHINDDYSKVYWIQGNNMVPITKEFLERDSGNEGEPASDDGTDLLTISEDA